MTAYLPETAGVFTEDEVVAWVTPLADEVRKGELTGMFVAALYESAVSVYFLSRIEIEPRSEERYRGDRREGFQVGHGQEVGLLSRGGGGCQESTRRQDLGDERWRIGGQPRGTAKPIFMAKYISLANA